MGTAKNNINADTAREMVSLYMAAEEAVLKGKSYSIGGNSLTRENLGEIRKGRQEWADILAKAESGGRRVFRQITPVDS